MSEHLAVTNNLFEEIIAHKNFSELDRVYTKGARVLPPGAETVTGIDAIKTFWQTAVEGLKVTSLKLNSVEHEHQGDTIIEIGRADLGIVGAADPMVVKYVVIWKQENGAWKWDIDIWNPVA